MNQIREKILTGQLKEGQELWSVRDLAKHLDISKNTVNTAYAKLAEEGYIYAKRGSGYFVVTRAPEAREESRLPGIGPGAACLFPWDQWKKILLEETESFGGQKGELGDQDLLKTLVKEQVLTQRGLSVKEEEILLCTDLYDGITQVKILFERVAGDVTFFEPCHPDLRRFFQEDYFQSKRFEDAYRQGEFGGAKGAYYHSLVCYLEKVLEETEKNYAYFGWLHDWLTYTKSYLLIYDSMVTGPVDLPERLQEDLGQTVILGTYDHILPEEVSFSYLILPDRLLKKYKNMNLGRRKIMPSLYQRTLARLGEGDFWPKYLQDHQDMRLREKEKIKRDVEDISGVEVLKDYDYLTEGILVRIQPEQVEAARKTLGKKGRKLVEASAFWYFQKEEGEESYICL